MARFLEERREYPVLEVIEALKPLEQPELLHTQEQIAYLVSRREQNAPVETGAAVAPIARLI